MSVMMSPAALIEAVIAAARPSNVETEEPGQTSDGINPAVVDLLPALPIAKVVDTFKLLMAANAFGDREDGVLLFRAARDLRRRALLQEVESGRDAVARIELVMLSLEEDDPNDPNLQALRLALVDISDVLEGRLTYEGRRAEPAQDYELLLLDKKLEAAWRSGLDAVIASPKDLGGSLAAQKDLKANIAAIAEQMTEKRASTLEGLLMKAKALSLTGHGGVEGTGEEMIRHARSTDMRLAGSILCDLDKMRRTAS